MSDSVKIFENEIELFIHDPAGPVGTYLETVALERVLPDAYRALSVPNVLQSVGADGNGGWIPNPPPGPPMLRSGQLLANIHPTPPMIDERGNVVVYVTSDPIGDGGQHYVKNYLLPRGYRFMGDDPNYTYVEE